jgi:hypothetical protein
MLINMFNPFFFLDYYKTIVINVKQLIGDYFLNKPERGLVENNMFLLGEHIIFSSLGVILFSKTEWIYDITMMWDYGLNPSIILYYFLYTIRYIAQIQMMTGKEKDYNSMMTHHISTVLLLSLSFIHYHRIGIIIAISHDLSDLLFLPAKLCHKFYETRGIKLLNTLSYIYFFAFFIIFFSTRIALNSKIICYIFYSLKDYNLKVYFEGYPLFFLLLVNLGIQFFWQIMIIKFAYNLILGEKPKDEKGNEYFKKK